MRKLPQLRALNCFEAVSRYPSFSSAAKALNLTHGAISHQVRSLEDWLGVRLFSRHSGGVRLTTEGLRLRNACSAAFEKLEQECVSLRSEGQVDSVTIGCSSSFLAHWLLPRLKRFSSGADADEINLRFDTTADWNTLKHGKIDLLIAGHCPQSSPDIERRLFANDVIGPVCKPGYHAATTLPDQILQSKLLHAKSRPTAWQEWSRAVGGSVEPVDGQMFETLSLSIEAARAGFGFAMAPEIVVQDELSDGRLAAPLGFVTAHHATYLYSRADAQLPPSARSFRAWLLSQAREI